MLARQDGRYAEYYDEEAPDIHGSSDEGAQRQPQGRALSADEEEAILSELIYAAQDNREFMKVLHIL